MIKIENHEVVGWEHAIRGMRNPMNSWDKSDTDYIKIYTTAGELCPPIIGENDHDLMMRLANGGPVHAKYRRMIGVYVDITAPLYWWKEFDTYKVGTVANSCSTMHKIHEKEFVAEDFSCEHLHISSFQTLIATIDLLNFWRDIYLEGGNVNNLDGTENIYQPKSKEVWWQMIQLLPSSYNQKRTVYLNYEVLANIYEWRKDHKLDEWRSLCEWIESLPYSEIITDPVKGKKWLMDELAAAQKQILELEKEILSLKKMIYEAGIEE